MITDSFIDGVLEDTNSSKQNKVSKRSVIFTIPGEGWHRIAKNSGSNIRQLAQFDIEWSSSSHGVASFVVSSSYGKQTNINQLASSYTGSTIIKVRVVQNSVGASADYQSYLEVYHTGNSGGRTLTVAMLGAVGWELLPAIEAGNVPSGFNAHELEFKYPNILSINQGGTGADNVADACTNLGLKIENGSWIPVLRGGDVAGNFTYDTQTDSYHRIGNRVFLDFTIAVSAKSGNPSGRLEVIPVIKIGRVYRVQEKNS